MNTRLVTKEDELVSLKDLWNNLVYHNPETAMPFFSWDWFYHSWLHFAKPVGQELFVVTVYDNEKLVGLLPLVRGSKKSLGISYKTLEFCNVGIIPRNTAYCDSNCDANFIFQRIGSRIFAERKNWDILELSNVAQSTRFYDYCQTIPSELLLAMIQTKGLSSPYAEFEGLTYEEYFSKYGNKDARRRFKRNTERFAAENKCWEMKIFETEQEIQQGIDLALAVRQGSWKGAFKNEEYVRFYRELFTALAQRREVLVPVLLLDEIPMAAQFITGCRNRFFLHTNDYDTRFRETAPGICLLHQMLITAFERQWKVFDFTGDDYDYKKDSQTGIQIHSTFQIFHTGMKSRFLYSAKTFWLPLIRKILHKPEPDDFISCQSFAADGMKLEMGVK
jgi:CelD/BcsL family acetyltransferase involved in cellulose biosynthesis